MNLKIQKIPRKRQNPEIDSDNNEVTLDNKVEESQNEEERFREHFVRISRRPTRKPRKYNPSFNFLL